MLLASSSQRGHQSWRTYKIVVLVPLLVVLTIFFSIFLMMGEASPTDASPVPASTWVKYTAVTGFFMQDDPGTDPNSFDYVTSNFGLKDQTYDTDAQLPSADIPTQWQRFAFKIKQLNNAAPAGTQYKLLYMGRHGEGYHNAAQASYGTEEWDCYWSGLDGDGTTTWSDAHLTPTGINQAQTANAFWKKGFGEEKIPYPESYYVSPLDRCCRTAQITFSGLDLPATNPFVPTVKELLREGIGIHTCDRRSSRTYISKTYPSYDIEPGFAEDDPLWVPDLRESDSAHTDRLKQFLDNVFRHDKSTFISFTSHSGSIAAILRAVGHRVFALQTGGLIPVLVKAETIQGTPPDVKVEPWTPKPTCGDFIRLGTSFPTIT